MADQQKMVYAVVEEMQSTLNIAAEDLSEVAEAMKRVAQMIGNGALLGMGGDSFVDALNGKFAPAIERLAERLRDEGNYVQREIDDMREAEQRSRGLFN
jgi:uncharacterized protein YukE